MMDQERTMTERTEAFVQLDNVTKIYRTQAGDFPALRGITADLEQGDFTLVVGKSGAGKSTLVNMISGVGRLSRGEIWVADTPVHALSEDRMALWRGRNVGVVYQSFELLPQLSLLDNVLLPMELCGLYRGQKSVQRAKDLLAQVGLAAHMGKPPTRISGGQRQRVAIARALANEPALLIADEPTGNLDSATAGEILDLFEALSDDGATIIMVTHDASIGARADRVLRLADGEIVDDTQPKSGEISL
jgi:putative ABC transport system ATP-binding protein